jgi:hypothetical protein
MAHLAQNTGKLICEALGLNPFDVTEISLHFKTGAVAEVAVAQVMFLTKDEEGNLIKALKKYDLVEK